MNRLLIVLVFGLLCAQSLQAQYRDPAQTPPRWIIWQSHMSPIPFDYVTDVAIDEKGRKWVVFCQQFGTRTGAAVARFDSTEWKIWPYGSSSCITMISVIPGDTAFFGFWRSSDQVLMQTIINDEIKSLQHCYRSGQFYDLHRTDSGLAILDGRLQFLNHSGDCNLLNTTIPFYSMYWGVPGYCLLGTADNGIYAYDGVNFSPLLTTIDSVDLSYANINAMLLEPDRFATNGLGGKLWFAFLLPGQNESKSGIGVWDGRKVKIIRREQMGIRSNFIGHIKRNPVDGSIWVGSLDGIARYHEGRWQAFNVGDAFMVGNEVSAIEFDALGNTWIGTNNGLVVYNPKGVIFSKPEAPPKPASLRLFPNPVADDLVVEYDAQFTGTAQLRLSTLSGQQLHSWSWQLTETGTQRYPLSLAGIPAGMYVLVLEAEHVRVTTKLIKY